MKSVVMAWRLLRRERHAEELRVVAVAILVAVASLVSVASFGDRLKQALAQQGSQLLAADVVVETAYPMRPEWPALAARIGVRQARTVGFRSVVVAGERSQLAEIKAVDDGYPLVGTLRIAADVDTPDRPQLGAPLAGTVWIDAQLLFSLRLDIGDSVKLGAREFRIAGLVTYEPDRGGEMFSIAPRLMLRFSDLAATDLIQPGSLVTYRWLLAGDRPDLVRLTGELKARWGETLTLRDSADARPRFRVAFERGERFFALATLVSMLLAGAAVACAASRYAARHLDFAALLRCVGVRQGQVVRVYAWQLLLLTLAASALGSVIGYAGQQVLVQLLHGVAQGDLPWPSPVPALVGVAAGLVIAMGFGMPAVLGLREVSPLRVLRRDIGPPPARLTSFYLLSLIGVAMLTYYLARDFWLSVYVLGGGLLTTVVLALLSLVLITLLGRMRGGAGAWWRYGLANLNRRRTSSTGQAVAAGVGIMGLLLLAVVRGDLLAEWNRRLPERAPNHFLVNIQPDQVELVRSALEADGLAPEKLSPIVRARLVSINGEPVDPARFTDGFARRAVQRAANLSWIMTLPDDNQVTAGIAWGADEAGQPLLSVEQEYAGSLGLTLGDKLVYRVADRELTVTIANLRSVSWDSLQPNFFLLVPPGVLDSYPQSYITSVHVPRADARKIFNLTKRFSNITDVDIDAILEQVRRIINRVNDALLFIFMFSIVGGLVVIYAVVHASRSERQQEIAVLRSLGAQRRHLLAATLAEFGVLGLLAGSVGTTAAGLVAALVAEYLFKTQYILAPGMWLAGLVAGVVLITGAGFIATRRLFDTPPWTALRQGVR
ncbi:MAG: FtsX-like permease family protein [Gammaproteobacteria bacterium]|nr:FtsX-like permease family protein [Gammaproteobacteria bacterium]